MHWSEGIFKALFRLNDLPFWGSSHEPGSVWSGQRGACSFQSCITWGSGPASQALASTSLFLVTTMFRMFTSLSRLGLSVGTTITTHFISSVIRFISCSCHKSVTEGLLIEELGWQRLHLNMLPWPWGQGRGSMASHTHVSWSFCPEMPHHAAHINSTRSLLKVNRKPN